MAKIRFEAGKKDDDKPKKSYQTGVADTNVVQKVDGVIEKALELNANEVHFDPVEETMQVRLRINGKLQVAEEFPLNLQSKIVNRIKVLSAMDITKTKLPQNGFFKVVTDDAKIEILSQTFPTLRGEKGVLKIQYKQGVSLSLDDLGMIPQMADQFKTSLGKTNGLILVAGPPGNGKNTTLYSILNYLSSPEKSLATFEKVIKYEIPGLVQGKPDDKAEFTFEQGVRSIINTEPDVLMIGDMNTPEVARHVVQAAFAKRIVLGRMMADNSVNAIQNLIDMGIPPFLVTSSINAVLSQRLVKKICPQCKEGYTPPEKVLQELGLRAGVEFFRGRGCGECGGTGYQGFIGIFELLQMREELSEMIIARESSRRVREAALNLGLILLKKDGLFKASKGLTTLEEVMNAV